jgi:hypothetical protein
MSAVLSAAGTFTPLATDLTKFADTNGDLAGGGALPIAPTDLQTEPDEIRQLVRVFQDGWGAQLGTNKRLDYWATCLLVEMMLKAHRESNGRPRPGSLA